MLSQSEPVQTDRTPSHCELAKTALKSKCSRVGLVPGARCQVRGARSLCIRYGRLGQVNVGGRSTKKVNGRLTQTGGTFPAQKFADTY